MTLRKVWLCSTFLCFVLFLSSCQFGGPSKKSVLIIAVDSLGFNELPCGLRGENVAGLEGLLEFCDDSVRFTHVFSTSTMSQPALASVLTGEYPFEHGVWHNGNQHLSAKKNTVMEEASSLGYRTSFFSGGAPIWRRSGLNQGFERFDANVKVKLKGLYRSASQVFGLFDKWLSGLAGRENFFSVLYLSDLQFPEVETKTKGKEVRSRTYESQLREISESLSVLIKQLKSKNRWHNTNVIFVGLNGSGKGPDRSEIKALNIHSENTQVALLIKPAKKKRDLGIEWSIDRNVSLADVGVTLFDLVGAKVPERAQSNFEVVSLVGVLDKPDADWNEERAIVIESGWPQWRALGSSRFAFRKNHFLYVFDDKVRIFNSLIDRLEVSPISPKDPHWKDKYTEMKDLLANFELSGWTGLRPSLLEKLRVGAKLWGSKEPIPEDITRLRHLASVRPWDSQIAAWEAHSALRLQDWKWLFRVAKRTDQRLWAYVASKNLEKPFHFHPKGCERYFVVKPNKLAMPAPQDCGDELLLKLIRWVREKPGVAQDRLKETFLRAYRIYRSDFFISRQNYSKGLHWAVDTEMPGDPTLADLYLYLPGSRKFLRQVATRIK